MLERFSESSSTYNSNFSFIDQIEQMAKSTQNSTNQSPTDTYFGGVSYETTERRVSEVLNTEEILNIAHDMNTERIENISMKLSDSLIINWNKSCFLTHCYILWKKDDDMELPVSWGIYSSSHFSLTKRRQYL